MKVNLIFILLISTFFAYGNDYEKGVMAFKNHHYKEAIEEFKKVKGEKSKKAKLNLGFMYLKGLGTKKDPYKAFKYFREAAKEDSLVAKAKIASMYRQGIGTQKDFKKSLEIYNNLADVGHVYSQIMLGLIYKSGKDIPIDYSRSLKYFIMASKHGSALADYEVGMFYCNGNGVKKDKKKCIEYLVKSTLKGYKKAVEELKLIAKEKKTFWNFVDNKRVDNIIKNIKSGRDIQKEELKLYKIVIASYLHSSTFLKKESMESYKTYLKKEIEWYKFFESSLIYFSKINKKDKVLAKSVILKHLENATYLRKSTKFMMEYIVTVNVFKNIYASGVLDNYENKKSFLSFVPPDEYDYMERLRLDIDRNIEKFNLLYRAYQMNQNRKVQKIDIGFLSAYPEEILNICHNHDYAKIKKLSLKIQKLRGKIKKINTTKDYFETFPVLFYNPDDDMKNCIESTEVSKLYRNLKDTFKSKTIRKEQRE